MKDLLIGAGLLIVIVAMGQFLLASKDIESSYGTVVKVDPDAPKAYDSKIYMLCTDHMFRTNRACKCVGKNAAAVFPEFDESVTIEDLRSVAIQEKFYLEVLIPCEPLFMTELCEAEMEVLETAEERTHRAQYCECVGETAEQFQDEMAEMLRGVDFYTPEGHPTERVQEVHKLFEEPAFFGCQG